jgi:hypothetical protein
MRLGALTLLLISLCAGSSFGDGLRLERAGESVTVTNSGAATLVSLKLGQAEVARLGPSGTVTLSLPDDVSAHGRFALEEWHLALKDLSPAWAPYHLRTSGFLLDALSPGSLGDPAKAANLMALANCTDDLSSQWLEKPALRLALVARAARHVPPHLTRRLMTIQPPTPHGGAPPQWPAGYIGLESASDSIRTAIEVHGASPDIIQGLALSAAWAADRGFSHRPLLDSLQKSVKMLSRPPDSPSIDRWVEGLTQALEQGREIDAGNLAVDVAMSLTPSVGQSAVLIRLACAGLDSGARRAIKTERWLAGQAYLRLAGEVCGDRIGHRARVAELFRRRGDTLVQGLNLVGALDWFRAALWFGADRQDRARLADTHAELAILGFRSANPIGAQEHLDKSTHYGPYRPRVIAASELKPRADPRARFGLIIIIIFVAFFAFRRLARLFSDARSDPRLD